MKLNDLKIGQDLVVGKMHPLDEAAINYQNKIEKIKKVVPHLWTGIVEMFHGRPVEVDSIEEITFPSGKHTIYFLEEPGHGWYLGKQGQILGEEDGGLDPSKAEAKKMIEDLAKWSLVGKTVTTKTLID